VIHSPQRAHGVVAAAVIVTLCWGSAAYALDGQDVLAAYSLTTWVGRDGFTFGDTNALAQDDIGYLWLGTSLGLVRFDGVRFVPWTISGVPPTTLVNALRVSSDGSLWVGLTIGIARIRNDQTTLYTARSGFGADLVTRIAEDHDKTIWASGTGGIWRFRNERWEQVGPEHGLAARASSALFVDRDGVLWVGTPEGIFRRDAARDRFEQVTRSASSVTAIADDASGSLWATDQMRTLTPIASTARVPGWPHQGFGAAGDLARDRHGNLWVGTLGQGLLRIHAAGSGQTLNHVTRRDGLSSNSVHALLEDGEGNIWVGMAGGLTRLSEKRVTSVAEGETVSSVATTADGSTWLGTNAGLLRVTAGRQQRYTEKDGLPSGSIWALYVDDAGTLWVATNQGLARRAGSRFTAIPLPDGVLLRRVTSITSDRAGRLWLTDLDDGVFRFEGGAFTPLSHSGLQRPMRVFADSKDRLWIGQLSGDLALHAGGRTMACPSADGSAIGTVTAIYEDSRGNVWVGTTTGLGRMENDRFVRDDIEDLASGVLAIVEDAMHQLWIATRSGILRASIDERARTGVSPGLTNFQVYDASDGLPGGVVRAFPGSARAADGSLWFATADGAARIVPDTPTEPRVRPGIRIETAIADDRQVAPAAGATLPAGTSRIEIQYTVLTLSSGASSRFLYRLDGYDQDWVRAGLRREAVYTNLPPGQYTFRVTSRGGGGPREEASWNFAIAPMFYQTRAFAVAMTGALLLLMSVAWRLRLAHVRNQFKAVLIERARIAREIHDTLLQGLFGVALQVDGISKQLESSPEGTKERLAAVRGLVSRYIRETRSSIWLLRSPSLEERDLPSAIQEAAEAVTAGTPVRFNFEVSGAPRPLPNELEEQVLRIAHEAIVNVVKHAQATTVHVTLQYDADALHLRVSDNGRGFDTVVAEERNSMRWGLVGMRERAAQVGAALSVSSTPGTGTRVELAVSTSTAR
jgi:signal transduction histidine kinase/ligand-binding sensor domain-containing protein